MPLEMYMCMVCFKLHSTEEKARNCDHVKEDDNDN